jgi:hypothetical protein
MARLLDRGNTAGIKLTGVDQDQMARNPTSLPGFPWYISDDTMR